MQLCSPGGTTAIQFNAISNFLFTINNSHQRRNLSTENNSSNSFHGSLSLYCTVSTQFLYGLRIYICRLNTEFSLQTTLDIMANKRSFTKKFAFVSNELLTLTPAHLAYQSAFRLIGWHFLPDEDGKMAERIWAVP